MRPHTIQIFLPTGDPKGIRQAEITTRTVRVYEIPRADLKKFARDASSSQPGVYFLVGENPQSEDGRPELYIGESDEIATRLAQQDADKSFWSRAYVALSLTNSWTKVHIRRFEFDAIQKATESASHQFSNKNRGFDRSLPAPVLADCAEFFETIEVLLATLGATFLEVPRSSDETPDDDQLFITHDNGIATGSYSSAGLTVFKGSVARPVVTSDIQVVRPRERLISMGVLEPHGDAFVFARDYEFSSPSGAAVAVQGRGANGWKEWKNASGTALDVLERSGSSEVVE